jgi:protein subunit release factor B
MKYDTDIETLRRQVIVETFRSSGPGGQRKNKVETSVRLRHPLSGIMVTATDHRLQSQNLKLALERLQKVLIRLNRPKKRRIPTSVSLKAKVRRIEERKFLSKKKKLRQSPLFSRNDVD